MRTSRVLITVLMSALLSAPVLCAAQGGDEPLLFDIEKIDPETFRAIAVRVPEGLAPRFDGTLNDEAWSLARR